MVEAFKQAKTYAALFLIATIVFIIATNDWALGFKIFVMITYWIFINKFMVRGGITKRIIWNAIYVFTGGGILYFFDLSLPALALKLISKAPFIGKGIVLVAILLKTPEAFAWAIVSVIFAWLAGIIQIEEVDAFKQAIIIRIDELRYR